MGLLKALLLASQGVEPLEANADFIAEVDAVAGSGTGMASYPELSLATLVITCSGSHVLCMAAEQLLFQWVGRPHRISAVQHVNS